MMAVRSKSGSVTAATSRCGKAHPVRGIVYTKRCFRASVKSTPIDLRAQAELASALRTDTRVSDLCAQRPSYFPQLLMNP